jgi:hypothetical protein
LLKLRRFLVAVAFAPLLSASAVSWADWTSSDATHVYGVITLPDASVIDVTYTGGYFFAQLNENSSNIDYWIGRNTPGQPYVGGVVGNAPDQNASNVFDGNTDMIAIGTGAGGALTFSSPVLDPVMGFISLNGPSLTFNAPLTVQDSGCGYWGCDTLTVDPGNVLHATNFGEGHGSVEFNGSYSSISFTESGSENWRGLQVGILGAAPTGGVPEPATWGVMLGGLGILALCRKLA